MLPVGTQADVLFLSAFPPGPSRFKSVSFSEAGLSFELPKQLAVSDIAVRILHTRYDHPSSLARMTHLRTHTPSNRVHPAMQSTQRLGEREVR